MEIERVFLNSFSIEKKPDNICQLIEAAIFVAASKYPAEFEKRKKRILNLIMHPQPQDIDEEDMSVGDEDGVKEPEKEEEDGLGTQQITAQTKKPVLKFKIIIRKPVQPELINKTEETHKPLCHNNTTSVASTKRTERVQVAPPESVRLVSDDSFEKQLDGDKKQSHKGFKKMESTDHDTQKKKEGGEEQTPTQRRTKECTTGLTKMNVATKRVQVAPHPKELSDCAAQKQSHKGFKKMESTDHDTQNKKEGGAQQTPTQRRGKECTTGLTKMKVATKPVQVARPMQKETQNSAVTRPMQKETENSAVARQMQKERESMSDMKKKFESSKRKFAERLAEEREAKRRIVMVDFHKMPKPAKDPRAPTRRCWSRKRF